MKEEKMMILAMLEEGKITSEEAIKLLEALDQKEDFYQEDTSSKSDEYTSEEEKNIFQDTFDNLEDIGSDIGNVLYDIFDGLKDFSSSFGFKNNYETITTDLEMDLDSMENPSLDLKAINGDINLRPTNKNVLLVKVVCQYKKGLLNENETYFDFTNIDGKITFTPKYNSNISITLDVSIPEKFYNEIRLNTTNGKIYIKDLNSRSAQCITSNSSVEIEGGNTDLIDLTSKNGKIEIKDINSKNIQTYTTNADIEITNTNSETIDAKTGNGKIILKDIKSVDITCKTSNSIIELSSIDSQSIYLMTSNGKIILNDIDTANAKNINLITSNGSIVSDILDLSKEAIFDLETSMGNINLDIAELIYTTNKQVNLGLKKIVAHSINYDLNKDHLNFVASTSNASIKIN